MCALTLNVDSDNVTIATTPSNQLKTNGTKQQTNHIKKSKYPNNVDQMEQIDYTDDGGEEFKNDTPVSSDDDDDDDDENKTIISTNENIRSLQTLVTEEDAEQNASSISMAVNLSLIVNILLLFSKIIVFIMTFSFAVIASLIDSVLDLLSQFIIWITDRKIKRHNKQIKDRNHKYPVGKTRLEPVGILTVSVLMIMLSVTVIRESVQALITDTHEVGWSVVAVSLLGGVVFLKFCLWLYCRKFKHSPTAQALAQDHINDVFSNLVALIVTVLASYYPQLSWLDPAGAILISFWIVWSWYSTGKDEVKKLVGRRADDDALEELKSICETHHDEAQLDVLTGYHIGRNILVEVEMIMPKETTLGKSHDICIELQQKLEKFAIVERAFVHCDYMHRGFDEHKQPMLR